MGLNFLEAKCNTLMHQPLGDLVRVAPPPLQGSLCPKVEWISIPIAWFGIRSRIQKVWWGKAATTHMTCLRGASNWSHRCDAVMQFNAYTCRGHGNSQIHHVQTRWLSTTEQILDLGKWVFKHRLTLGYLHRGNAGLSQKVLSDWAAWGLPWPGCDGRGP